MTLPSRPLATAEVEIYGESVTVRALSRSEALHVGTAFTKETADEAEAYILAKGCDMTVEQARKWLASNALAAGGALIERILTLSGLTEDPGEASPAMSGHS